MTLTASINPVVPLNLLFPLQRVICPQSRQSAKYRIVTHNFTNDYLTNGKTLVINWPLSNQYMDTWQDGTFDLNMTLSEVVRTRHHIRRFLSRSLVLKIKPNTGQTPGTTDKIGRRRNVDSSKGRALLNIYNLKNFYCCKESLWCGMNPTHFVTKL